MDNLFNISKSLVKYSLSILSVLIALITVVYSLRSGMIRSLKIGSLEIKGNTNGVAETRAIIEHSVSGSDVPFEIEHLARFYTQVLAQSKVSFWFSLVFASIGFAVIITAAYLFTGNRISITAIQVLSGVIVDAVAALFFVQAKRAQQAMTDFFDKLRKDRQQAESRKWNIEEKMDMS